MNLLRAITTWWASLEYHLPVHPPAPPPPPKPPYTSGGKHAQETVARFGTVENAMRYYRSEGFWCIQASCLRCNRRWNALVEGAPEKQAECPQCRLNDQTVWLMDMDWSDK